MSLIIAGGLAAFAASRNRRKNTAASTAPAQSAYLLGTDTLSTVGMDINHVAETHAATASAPHSATGGFPFFWAVGAGLTVATVLLLAEFGYAKARGWNHFLDRKAKGYG